MLLLLTASGFTRVSQAQFRAGTNMRSERSDVDRWTDLTAFSIYLRCNHSIHIQRSMGPHMAPLGKTSMGTFETET